MRRRLLERTERRTERPFWGGVLFILASLIIGYVTISFSFELLFIGGAYTAIGLVFAVVVFLSGVFALVTALVPPGRVRRRLSTGMGIMGMVFSFLSLVGALGGLFVGLVLGLIGGYLCIDWTLFQENHR